MLFWKITITIKPPILDFAPMWTHSTPHCSEKSKFSVSLRAIIIGIHAGEFYWQQIDVWAHDAHDIATEPQVIVQICRFSLSDVVSRN